MSPPDSLCPAALEEIAPKYRPLAERMAQQWYETPTRGNRVEIITSGLRKYEALSEDIRGARESVHLEYYRFADDSLGYVLRDLLMRKAQDSVRVFLIYDNMINASNRRRFFRGLKEAGCDVRKFTPSSRPVRSLNYINHRDHHKIAVIDGRVAYTGGMNLSEDYFLRWNDTHLRLEGPVVTALDGLFAHEWEALGGTVAAPSLWQRADSAGIVLQLVASRPLTKSFPLRDSYVYALDSTERYFYAKTPYFCPPWPVLKAMRSAASRGKDIRIVLPAVSDVWIMNGANRSYFRRCVRSGVHIYLDTGRFDHSKVFVTDDYFSSIGSANLDNRSLTLNFEENIYFYDSNTAVYLRDTFLQQCENCEEVTLHSIKKWSAARKMGSALMSIFVLDL